MSLLALKPRPQTLRSIRLPTLCITPLQTRTYSDRPPSTTDTLASLFSKAADAVTRPLENKDGQWMPRSEGREGGKGDRERAPRGNGDRQDNRYANNRKQYGGSGKPNSWSPSSSFTPRNGGKGEASSYSSSYDKRDSRPEATRTDSARLPKSIISDIATRSARPTTPPSLITLAHLSVPQISTLISSSLIYKHLHSRGASRAHPSNLHQKSIALIFSKRSTRTRVASESATAALGGSAMFLGKDDIQLGVNESEEDTARVVGSMVDGIMARVGDHSEIENLAKFSGVPVINALSDLYHPTQILADLMTLIEIYSPPTFPSLLPVNPLPTLLTSLTSQSLLAPLSGKKIAWVGDTNNITNDMLVTFPRLGMRMSVASPKGYDKVDPRVWEEVVKAGTEGLIELTNSPEVALKDADVVATDTWISMGQETEKASRLTAFAGYQVTESLCTSSGAKPDWKFLHCLPRKQEEVDDEVFYGKRSVVFQEAENRKWSTMACFARIFGDWKI